MEETHSRNTKGNTLALFDFDGTISSRNSFIEFVAFLHGRPKLYMGGLSFIPNIPKLWLGAISSDEFKRRFFAKFCTGMESEYFHDQAEAFSHSGLQKIIRPGAHDAIRAHRQKGDTVVVVSASFQEVLKPWCDLMDVGCIATVMEIEGGTVTGQLDTPICWGQQKVQRIQETLDLSEFDTIISYGNSRGDKEMLELADRAHFKPFR